MPDEIPPHSLESEQALLGAILINQSVMQGIIDVLNADDFYRHAHRLIWGAMCHLHSKQDTIDFVGVRAILSRKGELDNAGGPAYISRLTDGVPRSLNAPSYA